MKKIYFTLTLLIYAKTLLATPTPNVPILSYEHCSVSSSEDSLNAGQPTSGTLRHRISLYNKNLSRTQGGLCTYAIFFEFHDRTITLTQPLVIKNLPHGPEGGVDIDAYENPDDRDTTHNELLSITLDARAITRSPHQCALMLQGGFEAKHGIRGLTIIATQADRAICDENGIDLYHALSPNCSDHRAHQAFETGCDFADTTIVTPPTPTKSVHFDLTIPTTFTVNASDILLLPTQPHQTTGGSPGSGGMPASGGGSGSTPEGSGGSLGTGGMTGSGGNTGSGGSWGSGGINSSGGNSGSGGGSGGNAGISGSGGTAGTAPAPARSGREPDPFGCNLIMTPTNL